MSLDAMKQALEALEECIGYKTSPFMERECEAAITALRAAIEQAQDPETELETYKRLYELRGKALERPCLNCGHQPAKIKAMAQPEQQEKRMPITDDHGQALRPQYRVIEQCGKWALLYNQHQAGDVVRHEFRIQKLQHDIVLYPGITLAEAQKRFREKVESDYE